MLSKLCFCDSIFQLAEIWIGSSQKRITHDSQRLLAEVTKSSMTTKAMNNVASRNGSGCLSS